MLHTFSEPLFLIIMGVSGCGKTTLGQFASQQTGWPFADADDFHSAANVAKMQAGIPLTDEDRWPWLAALHNHIQATLGQRQPGILACSALKARYREVLQGGDPRVHLVYQQGSFTLIQARINARQDHYMPSTLLQSQFATLEEPTDAIVVGVHLPVEKQWERVAAGLENSKG